MNHSKKVVLAITFILALLVITGCATPQAQACPTSTAQSCPTAAAVVQPTMDAWRISYNDQHVNVRITFDPGKKCSMDILRPVTGGELFFEIVVNDNTYRNYMVGASSLAEGKTIEDLVAYVGTVTGKAPPPSWADVQTLDIVAPMSRTWHAAHVPVSPIYFECFIEGPDAQQSIAALGPVEISQ